jgi:hypothetical protein
VVRPSQILLIQEFRLSAPLPRPEYGVRKDGLLQTAIGRFLATRYNKFVTTRQGTS